jgi:hypothetical protein
LKISSHEAAKDQAMKMPKIKPHEASEDQAWLSWSASWIPKPYFSFLEYEVHKASE